MDFLRSHLTTTNIEHLETLIQEKQHEEDCKVRAVYSKKLLALTLKSNKSFPNETISSEKWVLNIAIKPLSSTKTSALQKRDKFFLARRKLPPAEIVASVEDGIYPLPEEDKLVLTSQISQVLQIATAPPSNRP